MNSDTTNPAIMSPVGLAAGIVAYILIVKMCDRPIPKISRKGLILLGVIVPGGSVILIPLACVSLAKVTYKSCTGFFKRTI
jgi:hypothetical protein